jgi:UDP-N-acetylmuramoylalanine--D-glutamate ligase
VIFNDHFKETQAIAQETKGKKIAYTEKDAPLAIDQTKLLGTHNLGNIAAAFLASKELHVDEKTALDAIKSFQGLPHRLQSLGTYHEIEWVDDAISTTPESAIAAIDALGDQVGSIILGGQDRGLDFTPLAKRIGTSSINNVILLGEDSARIGDAIKKERTSINLHPATSIQEVVSIAKEVTPKGTVCLLSPASPSYDMFKNFEEKGDRFAEEIRK